MTDADGASDAARPSGSDPVEPVSGVEPDDDRTARREALRALAAMIGVEVFY